MSNILTSLLDEQSHAVVKKRITSLQLALIAKKQGRSSKYVRTELQQILDARTLDRARYYIRRLVKGLTEVKIGKLNDLNLNRWKEYDSIFTDSLWIFDKRDRSGTHNAEYWGNFIPQIPSQLLRRYTKKGECVLDPFLGSGTTLIECRKLGRNGIGIELQPSVARKTRTRIAKENNPFAIHTEVVTGDSTQLDLAEQLRSYSVSSVQFALLHPPYWNIIHFSKNKHDLSNASSLQGFLSSFGRVIEQVNTVLDAGRYLAIVIGDKYSDGELVPLGFLTMREAESRGFKLKSIIIKNFKDTKAKRSQEELWRYRALVGGFYVFKHEYIFLMQKK
jgi:SAM-dependent methyltransferase